ncbi:MAG: response regulator [Anaeromyxobacter sp.]
MLLVEDEPVLRASMARGLARVLDVEVWEAGTVDEAVARIAAAAPACIVSDIDLPGRTGLELIGELARRRLDVPLLFVSAYLKTYRAQIPPNARVEILEKPVPLEQLRAWVLARLGERTPAGAPFGVTDYVQLACMGHHSVEIAVTWAGGGGRIVVAHGTIWSARDGAGEGLAAFRRLAFHRGAGVECRSLMGDPGKRSVEEPWEVVLLESARLVDEERHAGGPHAAPPAPPGPTFEEHWDAGVEALLARDFPAALAAFLRARALRPDDGRVIANLKRLAELGYPEPPAGGG